MSKNKSKLLETKKANKTRKKEESDSESFTVSDKKRLIDRIKKLKNPKYLTKIFTIIMNSCKNCTQNKNGSLFVMNDVSSETFKKNKKYVTKYEKKIKKKERNLEKKIETGTETSMATPDDISLTT